MKKLLFALLLLVLITGSFLVGKWYNERGDLKTNRSDLKASGIAAARRTGTNSGTVVDTDTDTSSTDLSSMPPGAVKINSQKQQLIGVRVEKVEKESQKQALRTLGRVVPNENLTYRILSSAEGWVWDVHESTTGSLVKKDQLMATVYNFQFLTRQQQYFYALESEERKQKARAQASNPQQQQGAQQQLLPPLTYTQVPTTLGSESTMSAGAAYSIRDQLEIAKLELYSLGAGDYQIQEITRTKKLASDIQIRSPVTGIVLSRNVSPQQRFDRGLELFRIADLSRVWIVADVFGREAEYIRPGMTARVFLPDFDKVFKAIVSNIPPQVDPVTRTLKVRLEAENPGFVLRPDMFVDVEFSIVFPAAITVPADAVLDSGLRKTVFVELGNGFIEPREVETGRRVGNRVEITKGLKTGEGIATSGTFLIDSESRLGLAAAGIAGTLSKDPVCGIDVSVNKAEKSGRKISYRGKTYYFTSDECKVEFEKKPDKYIEKP